MAARLTDAQIRQHRQWDAERHQLGLQCTLLRVWRGWTQADLAKRAQCPLAHVVAIESGDLARASLKTLKLLAGAFDVALLIRFAAYSTWLPRSWYKETP